MSSQTEELVQKAISEAKSGNRKLAKDLFAQVIKSEPDNARVWYLMSQVMEDKRASIYCLEQVLRIQPDNMQAKERLQKLSSVLNPNEATPVVLVKTDVKTLDELGNHANELQSFFDDLVKNYANLATFREAASWKSDAYALTHLFENYLADLESYKTSELHSYNEAKNSRESLPALKRLSASQSIEKKHKSNIDQATKGIESVRKAIEILDEMIVAIPINKLEQKEILSDIRLYKKEIALQKRQINQSMRQIRTESRQKMTALTGVNRGFAGDIARFQRRSLRLNKENQLAPLENVLAALDKELIEIERKIVLITRLKGDDSPIETNVLRCAYCGRRINPGSLCPGCGSDRTIIDSG